MPFFSIITPTYNRAKFINKALESVLKQTFLDFEYIIIDDGSTDNTRGIIETFSDNRIRYIYQENQERSAARNHGIDLANGEYICFLDSDDYYLENHLEILWQNITKIAKPGLYYTQSYKQNIQSNIITPIIQNTNVSKINFLLNNFVTIYHI
jgi:glycosyltransferase involved in cell wall biosynthesis